MKIMTYRLALFIMGIIALVSWASLALVILKLDPCTGPGILRFCHSISGLSLFLFFLSAFFALTATFSILGFGLRLWFHNFDVYLDHLTVSFRQGLLLTLCALGALALLILNALTWWSGLLLIAIIVLIETYCNQDSLQGGVY